MNIDKIGLINSYSATNWEDGITQLNDDNLNKIEDALTQLLGTSTGDVPRLAGAVDSLVDTVENISETVDVTELDIDTKSTIKQLREALKKWIDSHKNRVGCSCTYKGDLLSVASNWNNDKLDKEIGGQGITTITIVSANSESSATYTLLRFTKYFDKYVYYTALNSTKWEKLRHVAFDKSDIGLDNVDNLSSSQIIANITATDLTGKLPVATSNQLGAIKSGEYITVDENGDVTVANANLAKQSKSLLSTSLEVETPLTVGTIKLALRSWLDGPLHQLANIQYSCYIPHVDLQELVDKWNTSDSTQLTASDSKGITVTTVGGQLSGCCILQFVPMYPSTSETAVYYTKSGQISSVENIKTEFPDKLHKVVFDNDLVTITNDLAIINDDLASLDSLKVDKTTVAKEDSLGLVKSGGDITVDTQGNVTVNATHLKEYRLQLKASYTLRELRAELDNWCINTNYSTCCFSGAVDDFLTEWNQNNLDAIIPKGQEIRFTRIGRKDDLFSYQVDFEQEETSYRSSAYAPGGWGEEKLEKQLLESDLDNYCTIEEVDNKIKEVNNIDFTDYYTKNEANGTFVSKTESEKFSVKTDLDNYYTKDEIGNNYMTTSAANSTFVSNTTAANFITKTDTLKIVCGTSTSI